MKELLYFSFSDLLVKVEYNKEANSLKYLVHREININERIMVEQYILSHFALKTEYYRRRPALFMYLGVEKKLFRDLNLLHLKNTLKSLLDRDKKIKEQVKKLINQSLSNYYFEQIGDAILALRQEVNTNCRAEFIDESRDKMAKLVEAYNLYSDRKVKLEEIIPQELKSYINV